MTPFKRYFPNFREKRRQILDLFLAIYACFPYFSSPKMGPKVVKIGSFRGPEPIFGRQPKSWQSPVLHHFPENAHLGMPQVPKITSPNDSQTTSCRRMWTHFCGRREPKCPEKGDLRATLERYRSLGPFTLYLAFGSLLGTSCYELPRSGVLGVIGWSRSRGLKIPVFTHVLQCIFCDFLDILV